VLEGAEQCYIWRLRIPFENTANPRNYLQKLLSYQTLLEAETPCPSSTNSSRPAWTPSACVFPTVWYNVTNPGSVWTSEVTELIRASGVTDKEFPVLRR